MPNWKKVIVSGSNASLNSIAVSGTGSFGSTVRIGSGSASEYALEIGAGRTGNGFAYIDFIGDTTYTDYGLRIIRGNTGANTTSTITTRGTGDFILETNDIAPIVFKTLAIERARISSGGNLGVGSGNPSYKLTVETSAAVDGIALNGSNNFVLAILESGTVRGYSPAFPTSPGAFSTDSNTRDFVYRVEAATQRFLFNTNAGTGGSTLAITGSRVGINTATPTLGNLTVNGNVWANSYTGSLFGTASWANNAVTASYLLNFPVNPNLYATQNDNLGIVSANTAYSMSFNTLVTSDQLNLVSGSRLEVTSAGKYNIQFSANIKQTSNSLTEVYIWLSRDGTTDLADTNRQITMDGAGNNFTVASWNWVVDAGDNQYYEIRYGASDTNIQLNYQSTPSLGPEIPAAIVSMFKIN
jgi:hypothetical protein